MKVLLIAALIFRQDVKVTPDWRFIGTFEDFKLPQTESVF